MKEVTNIIDSALWILDTLINIYEIRCIFMTLGLVFFSHLPNHGGTDLLSTMLPPMTLLRKSQLREGQTYSTSLVHMSGS